MAEPWQRQRALDYRSLDAAPSGMTERGFGVRMWVEKANGQLCLRGDAKSGFAAVVESVWGVALPVIANTVSGHGDDRDNDRQRILWLGPDEWLAVCAEDEAHGLHRSLLEALGDEHALVSDVSHSRVVIALQGEHAREVLCKGCGLDLDPAAFKPGHCAQSSLARTHMLLHQLADTPLYHVYVHRSFAGYVYSWLEDAAQEYMQ